MPLGLGHLHPWGYPVTAVAADTVYQVMANEQHKIHIGVLIQAWATNTNVIHIGQADMDVVTPLYNYIDLAAGDVLILQVTDRQEKQGIRINLGNLFYAAEVLGEGFSMFWMEE